MRTKRMYDLALFWLPLIAGGVFVTAGFSALYAKELIHAIWYFFFGIAGFLLLGTVQLDHFVRNRNNTENKSSTVIIDRSDAETQRGRIFIENISNNMQDWRQGNWPFVWKFRFVNYGLTAARIIKIWAFVDICDDIPQIDGERPIGIPKTPFPSFPIPEDFDFSKTPILERNMSTEIFEANGNRAPLRLRETLPEEVRAKRQRLYLMTAVGDMPGAVKFWLVGRIEYKDIFGDNLHTTQFAYYLTNPSGDFKEYPNPAYNYQN